MKRSFTLALGAFVVFASLACGAGDTTVTVEPKPVPAAAATPEGKAAAVADAVKSDASKMNDALKEQGLTSETYEDLLFSIAGDAARTKAYLEARKKP